MSMDLKGKKIVLGLTGGVACYKAAELCRALVKQGASVQVVMSDAATHFIGTVTMQALSGNLTDRARSALKAGCDLVVHWNGDMAEMRAVAEGVVKLKGASRRRADAALARIVHTPEPLDVADARDRLDTALRGRLDAAAGPDVGEAQA